MNNDQQSKLYTFKKLRLLSIICIFSLLSPLVVSRYSLNRNFVVYTDSMFPTIKKGDIIQVENIEELIQNGTILVFKSPLGGFESHRVVEIRNIDNKRHYITKGDNNPHRDSFLLTDEMVIGKVVNIIPKVGYIFLVPREIFLITTILFILTYVYLSLKPVDETIIKKESIEKKTIITLFLIFFLLPNFVKCNVDVSLPYSSKYLDITTPKTMFTEGTKGDVTVFDDGNNANITLSNTLDESWWDTDYKYRKKITIQEESGEDLVFYPVDLTINTEDLVDEGKMEEDCRDIRFIGSSYIYELPVTIENDNEYDLVDHQVKVEINDENIIRHMRSDGGDIRVFYSQKSEPYDSDDFLPIWIEEGDSQVFIFWVKVDVPATSSITLYMYYGQGDSESTVSGSDVFQYYDDFSYDSLNDYEIIDLGTTDAPSNWQVFNGVLEQSTNIYTHGAPDMNGTYAILEDNQYVNCTLESRIMSTDDDFIGLIFGYKNSSSLYRFSWLRQDHTSSGSLGPGRYLYKLLNGNWALLDSDNTLYTANRWYDLEIRFNETEIQVLVDDLHVLSGVANNTVDGRIGFYSWACQNAVFDDLRVRKNAVILPVVSFGSENQISFQSTELAYWIENGIGTSNTKIWVKIPSITASQNETMFLYYGNPGAVSQSDPKSAFTAYQDFILDGIDGGVAGQDGQSGLPTSYFVSPDGSTLSIWGNVWKYTEYDLMVVGDGSQVLELDMRSSDNGEIQGIGISNTISGPDSSHTYRFTGSQSWGLTPNKKYSGAGGDWQYVYAVLDDFSGSFDYFIWAGDDDVDGSQNCSFRNVRIRPYTSQKPSVLIDGEETIIYDYVLSIVNNVSVDWLVRLVSFDELNIGDISYLYAYLDDDGVYYEQLKIVNGSYLKDVGDFYNLVASDSVNLVVICETFEVDYSVLFTCVEYRNTQSGVQCRTNINMLIES